MGTSSAVNKAIDVELTVGWANNNTNMEVDIDLFINRAIS